MARAQTEPAPEAPEARVQRLLDRLKSSELSEVRLAAVVALGDLASNPFDLQAAELRAVLLRRAAPELRDRALHGDKQEPDPNVRRAILIALGRIRADGSVAVPAWKEALSDPDKQVRLAVGQALEVYVNRSLRELPFQRGVDESLDWLRQTISDMAELEGLYRAGLKSADPDVVTNALQALVRMVVALERLDNIPSAPAEEDATSRKAAADRRKLNSDLLRVAAGLRALTPELLIAANSKDGAQQLLALQVFEEMARLRDDRKTIDVTADPKVPRMVSAGRLLQDDIGPSSVEAAAIVTQAMQLALPRVSEMVVAPRTELRLLALEVLELMGTEASTYVQVVTTALADTDNFVRWGAARALGRMGGLNYPPAIQGLAALLSDEDIDVSIAAARALEGFGPASAPAVYALATELAKRDDVSLRVAIVYALRAVGAAGKSAIAPGPKRQEAVAALIAALQARETRVRKEVPAIISMFVKPASPQAKLDADGETAVAALKAALQDDDGEVRERASEALIEILGK